MGTPSKGTTPMKRNKNSISLDVSSNTRKNERNVGKSVPRQRPTGLFYEPQQLNQKFDMETYLEKKDGREL